MSVVDGRSDILTEVLVNVEGLGLDSDVLFQIYLVADQAFQATLGCLQLPLQFLRNEAVLKHGDWY